MLAADVLLVSMGDHFDWGKREETPRATDEGLALLAWLAHHEPNQVVIIAGNHDLGRVGELATFDDETFVRMRDEARIAYDTKDDASFLARWPELPTAEVGARDFSCFRAQQRVLVAHLLQQHRFQLAFAPDDGHLFLHAGVTIPHLEKLGMDPKSTAQSMANALNRHFERAVDAWDPTTRLSIPHLHTPGDKASGEGGGILYHRAAFDRWNARRFDPRLLPLHVTQLIGHVRDQKSRTLLTPAWCKDEPAEDGPIRHLTTDGKNVHYAHGLPDGKAQMIFLDGGMHHIADPKKYELYRF